MHMQYVWRPLGLCAMATALWLTGAVNAPAAPAAAQAAPGAKIVADNDADSTRDRIERRLDRQTR